ncbi:Inner membrane ABC transporter permease protein YtfT [Vibrio ruber DSM 16370]|uniref:Inner membrane ABC transporter permease protein YtfT n=1 Tax=Vibrio ruber (strain DSM 16370 / JCM 11486 / BCRC 17186 / CECT 7878 / LMG 23124 / VR1) TaxID=1123498 RepID=A0A1R4LKQ1_VIBR1|nr:galactofuranose ABC transporter, ATP-binding protein YtfT [Vibrio ruber]SJN57176.1 Inner membrane ABC transporter permease protein YtfT [Vibrio ruber DSM 16370]
MDTSSLRAHFSSDWKKKLPKGTPQIAALICVLLINNFAADNFFSINIQDGRLFGSVIDILNRCSPVALLTIGMTLVIATGGIDLSVGAVMAISGATFASLATQDYPIAVIILASLMAGALCGLWNGFLVAVFKIQPIVATLILMVAGRGIAQLITEGQIVTFNNETLAWIGSGSFLYLPTPVVITIVVAVAIWLLTQKTALGLFIESVGINIRAAKNAGINAPTVVISTYVISGITAAVAGMIVAADIRGADANNAGLWLEMDAILAVVIGGTSLAGGRFNLFIALIGALIIQGVNTGILLSGYQPQWNQIVKAIVVLLVLVMQSPAVVQLLKGGRQHDKA